MNATQLVAGGSNSNSAIDEEEEGGLKQRTCAVGQAALALWTLPLTQHDMLHASRRP